MKKSFLEIINPKLINRKNLIFLNKQFSSAKPYPHIFIENFLEEKFASLLLKKLKSEPFIEKESDLFNFKQTHDLHFSKSGFLKDFNSTLLSWDFFNFVSQITGKKFHGTLDMAGTLYESSSFLLCHDDKLDGRQIAYILYLAKGFTKKDGGAFALYNSKNKKPTTAAKKYLPKWNSLLLFEVSPISFHEVEENVSKKSRYAVGGWLR